MLRFCQDRIKGGGERLEGDKGVFKKKKMTALMNWGNWAG